MPVIRTKRKKNKTRGQPTPNMSDYPPESKGEDDGQYKPRRESITTDLVEELTSQEDTDYDD